MSEPVESIDDNTLPTEQMTRMTRNDMAITLRLQWPESVSQAYIKHSVSNHQPIRFPPGQPYPPPCPTQPLQQKMTILLDLQGIPMTSTILRSDLDNIKRNLNAFATLFLQHNMHKHYAISYLHYTFNIPLSMSIIHQRIGTAKYCLPLAISTLDTTHLQPHTYILHNGTIQVLEFEYLSSPTILLRRPQLPSDFLTALAAMLNKIPCGDMIALCPREEELVLALFVKPVIRGSGGGGVSGGGGIRTTTVEGVDAAPGQIWVETQWRFDTAMGCPVVFVQQKSLVRAGC